MVTLSKMGYKTVKVLAKKRKLTKKDLKDIGLDEIAGIADDLATAIDPDASPLEKAAAIADLVIGSELGSRNKAKILEKLGISPEKAKRLVDSGSKSNKSATKPTGDNPVLGENGVQVESKTLWNGNGKERIDVENPNPGQRAEQIHYQDNNGNKYLYDPEKKISLNAPNSVNKKLLDPKFKAAVEKALTKYLGEGA